MTATAYEQAAAIADAVKGLGAALLVGELAELAGIPAGRQLQRDIADIVGVPLAELRAADPDLETGAGWAAVLGGVKVASRAVRSGAVSAWKAARTAPGLTLGLAAAGAWTLNEVFGDPKVRQAEEMARVLSDQLDRLPPAERAKVLRDWGQTYAANAAGSSIPWALIAAGAAALIAWKVLR
jgi:hypothetical protein